MAFRALSHVRHRQAVELDFSVIPFFNEEHLAAATDALLDAAEINRRIAARERAFVGAMTQVNSSNYGYNLPIKYIGADYYSMNRTEAELCLHERNLPAAQLLDTKSYDGDGRLITDTNSVGVTTTDAYNDNGLLQQVTETGTDGSTAPPPR